MKGGCEREAWREGVGEGEEEGEQGCELRVSEGVWRVCGAKKWKGKEALKKERESLKTP